MVVADHPTLITTATPITEAVASAERTINATF